MTAKEEQEENKEALEEEEKISNSVKNNKTLLVFVSTNYRYILEFHEFARSLPAH